MSTAEAIAFEQHPLFELSLRMRHWDEAAKEINQPVPDLGNYRGMALALLS
jgi:2-amino-1-hydroxyethylphosphonate dioxygenase (glycine-forming)